MVFDNHTHTTISNLRLLDCINDPIQLIDKAIELGLAGIAITDHEALCAHMDVNEYAKKLQETHPEFTVALGDEIYLTDTRDKGQKYYHFILIAKDAIGHRCLRELSTKAWLNSYYDRGMERVPLLKEELKSIYSRFRGHLIATTACLGGELGTAVLNLIDCENALDTINAQRYHNQIAVFLEYCLDLFGDDFYIEVAPAKSKDQIAANNRFVKIAEAFGIKMCVGSDSHYLRKEDRYVHKAYLTSKPGEREVDSFYEYCYLMDEQEIRENLRAGLPDEVIDQIFRNSMEIAKKIEFYDLSHSQQVTEVPVKDYPKNSRMAAEVKEYPTLAQMFVSDNIQERYWVNQCFEGLEQKIGEWDKHLNYVARLEEEADTKRIIGEKLNTNMFAYPITLQHYIDLFWKCGSLVGPGRGSSCSGLNHYLLNVTQLDPIKYDLPWFRYLNRERVELGDIDLDLAPSRRPSILSEIKSERAQYLKADLDPQFKANLGCTMIATFGTETAKSAILTACFKKGTLVDTYRGEVPIEQLKAGDLVKTQDGFEPILVPTLYLGIPNYKIKTKNSVNKEFYCTEDHEILTIPAYRRVEGKSCTSKIKKIFPELNKYSSYDSVYDRYIRNIREVSPVWKPANQIQNGYDYGLTLIDTSVNDIDSIHWTNNFRQKFGIGISETIPINENFCELIGIWIAEGSINKNNNAVSFTIHQDEEFLKLRIIQLMWEVFHLDNVCITTRLDSKAMTISYSSSQLAQFFFELFDNTGVWKEKRADNTYHYLTQWDKRVPTVLMNIDPYLQLQIIKGWFLGDGYARPKGQSGSQFMKCTTVSKRLAQDMITLFHRNFINPSVDIEQRSLTRQNKCDCYNLSLYGDYGQLFHDVKYTTQNKYNAPLIIPIEIRRKDDLPVLYNNKLYMKTKLEAFLDSSISEPETVYCLKMPNQNFSVNNTIVHNCRGYRSKDYPSGIDVDDAQYMTGLIPIERGLLWPLQDVVHGNPEKERKPVKPFLSFVNQFPGLLDIMLNIEGLINKRSSHASGVILFSDDPFEHCCFMKTPKGEIITQWDLHKLETAGNVKYDFLVVEVLDKIIQAIQLLQEDEEIDPTLSLREVYNKYFHPDVFPMDDKDMWKALQDGEVLNAFQFDSEVGGRAMKKIAPKSLQELADANGLMRLMPSEKGAEMPLDKYVRFKDNIQLWYKEMDDAGLSKTEQKILEPYFLSSYGVPPSQEQLMRMLMDPNICGFSLADANAARKIVGKKQIAKIPALHEKVLKSARSQLLGQYVWKNGIGPQMGYSFSLIHALAYSILGLQTGYIATHWNPVYWNTACLIVNSGSLEDASKSEIVDIYAPEADDLANGVTFEDLPDRSGKVRKTASTDYSKVAKAIGEIRDSGVEVSLLDINKSGFGFKPDAANNRILYGLKGAANISDDFIKQIIANRPYVSMYDFYARVHPKAQQMVSLIKGGAFDSLEPRCQAMVEYVWLKCDKKKRITLQNLPSLIRYGLLPEDTAERIEARKFYEFTRYLKAECKYLPDPSMYLANDIVIEFLNAHDLSDLLIINTESRCTFIDVKMWDKVYQKQMDVFRDWIASDKEGILNALNDAIFMEEWEKYGKGNLSSWEMEALCFYYHPHELIDANIYKYGISNYKDLPEVPVVEKIYQRGNASIPIYRLNKICGTCIAKDKAKSTVYLLTTQGVVTVKFTKEYFSMFDRRISTIDPTTGKKKFLENSWFNRGSMIMVKGFRREDMFVSRNYAASPGHQLYRITQVLPNGDLELQGERVKGEAEEDDEV